MSGRGQIAALAPALAGALILPGAAAAQGLCRMALLLALDVSSSVDAGEDRLQRTGLAAALLSPAVTEALLSRPGAPVALAAYEWSGRYQQKLLLDWRLITAPGALQDAAATIRGSTRSHDEFPTALGYGLGYAAQVFRRAPDCLFRTLDVSGDGINNDGFGPALAYANFPLDGITVNALVIGGATAEDQAVFDYYSDEVIRGPGAFVETAQGYHDYEAAMRRKLERELRSRVIGALGER